MASADSLSRILVYSVQAAERLAEAGPEKEDRAAEMIEGFILHALNLRRGRIPRGLCRKSLDCLRNFIDGDAYAVAIIDDDAAVFMERLPEGGWEVTEVAFRGPTLH